jgi:hypothetical protein
MKFATCVFLACLLVAGDAKAADSIRHKWSEHRISYTAPDKVIDFTITEYLDGSWLIGMGDKPDDDIKASDTLARAMAAIEWIDNKSKSPAKYYNIHLKMSESSEWLEMLRNAFIKADRKKIIQGRLDDFEDIYSPTFLKEKSLVRFFNEFKKRHPNFQFGISDNEAMVYGKPGQDIIVNGRPCLVLQGLH